MTYRIVAEGLVETALDLQEDALAISSGHGWRVPVEDKRVRALNEASGLIARAAEMLLELDPSPELAAEVRALEEMCLCGHDRGDHGVEAPHLCEGVAFVEGVRASFTAAMTGDFICPCEAFEAETLSPPDLMNTEPPSAAALTTPPEVA